MLQKLYKEQGVAKYMQGDFQKGKLDQWGQRINIVIEVPGINEAKGKNKKIISGWMIQSDNQIKLNTPFSGFKD